LIVKNTCPFQRKFLTVRYIPGSKIARFKEHRYMALKASYYGKAKAITRREMMKIAAK
jgi:hypothetical protein